MHLKKIHVQKHEIYIIHSYVLSIILFMKLKVFTKTVSQIAFISSKTFYLKIIIRTLVLK